MGYEALNCEVLYTSMIKNWRQRRSGNKSNETNGCVCGVYDVMDACVQDDKEQTKSLYHEREATAYHQISSES